ncbi:MAG: hypothetical protein U0821_07165 [Chloroflexota bacterium]
MWSVLIAVLVGVCALLTNVSGVAAHDQLALPTARSGAEPSDVALVESLNGDIRAATQAGNTRAAERSLIEAAERRLPALQTIAATDPRLAVRLALSASERRALPPAARDQVEEWSDLSGELRIAHVDREDGTGIYDVAVITSAGSRPVRAAVGLAGLRSGDQVDVKGLSFPGDSTVIGTEVNVRRAGTSVGSTGVQRTAVVLVSAPGQGAHPYIDKSVAASLVFSSTSGQSMRAFFDQASYGQTTVVGGSGGEGTASDVYGPYVLTADSCSIGTILSGAVALADADIDFNSYDRLVIAYNRTTGASCGYGGVAYIGSVGLGLRDGAYQNASAALALNTGLGSATLNAKIGGVILHEYGHSLGVYHANALECGVVAIGADACASSEYADPADIMGSSGGYGHPNGVHKDMLGWLGGGRVQTVTASGTYTVNAYENGTADTKVIRIPRSHGANGAVNAHYYLELRKPPSPWTNFTSGRPEYNTGVLVHASGGTPFCTPCSPDFTGSGGGGDSNLVDTAPNSLSGGSDLNDAPLTSGQSYTDDSAGVAISVVSVGASSATVNVTFQAPRYAIRTLVYPAGAGAVTGGGFIQGRRASTVTAVPSGNYVFSYWRENRSWVSSSAAYTFDLVADRTLEAVFTQPSTPPANDSFASAATASPLPYFSGIPTSSLTTQSGEPTSVVCETGTQTTGKTAWYRVSSATPKRIRLSTVGSSYDTLLAVYAGSAVNALTPLGCNDDSGGSGAATLDLDLAANVTYYVQVGGKGAASGSLQFRVADLSAPGPTTGRGYTGQTTSAPVAPKPSR